MVDEAAEGDGEAGSALVREVGHRYQVAAGFEAAFAFLLGRGVRSCVRIPAGIPT